MKNKLFSKSTFFILGLICVCFSACKKDDSPYYDYVNTIQTFDGTALEYLKAQPEGTFDSLLLVLDRLPLLQEALSNDEVTLFAPVNKNFEAAIKYLNLTRAQQEKAPIYLADADLEMLEEMVCKYVIQGNRTTEDYINNVDGLALKSVKFDYPMHVKYTKISSAGYVGGGPTALKFSDTFGSIFTNEWITTTANAVNIKTNNATINILTPIHIFGFDEFTFRLNN